ncbi:XRE family transcriptional regulator [Streptomyces sp. S07_1.15]|uniref:helix-turn-helix domain-containing protein n=1 Tax=Streptomyces sp. S07_1.15 TaxID=2873925 RepID=UPI001D1446A8|nr:XRE family transcriptional regulator [Streptomyces sp. S07_1.15]MCC3652148.1 XRE family transcriptional regulator [Streptomyces sp. S07_1.15]
MTGTQGSPRPPGPGRAPAARPPGLAPECARLAEELRELRKGTGLSLAALAERTPYSKSSWERYLNGKKQAPRQAVEALCRLAGERPERLLVLWDLADAEWSGRGAFGSAAPRPPRAARTPRGRTAGGRAGTEGPGTEGPGTEGPGTAVEAGRPPGAARGGADGAGTSAETAGGAVAGSSAAGTTRTAGTAGEAVAARPEAPGPGSRPPRPFRWPTAARWRAAVVAAAGATVAVVGALALGGVLPDGSGRQAAAGPGSSASASPSLPPPGCRGAACDGKDPESMGCGIAVRTLGGHRTAGGAGMEIRYSERCGAAWARIWQSGIGDRIRITASGGRFQQATVADRYDAESYLYTPMVGAGERSALRACLLPATGGQRECFGTTEDGDTTEDGNPTRNGDTTGAAAAGADTT